MRLTLAALLLGAALAVPAGILVSRVPRLEGLVLGLAGVVQTVPALALLAVMVPLLSSLGLSGIGFLPAFLGLVLYSLLPILRNTVTGLAGIDPAVREAAEGVGMTPAERLRIVELPLALPVILAGLRTATVWSVGMATLSTPVGAPSLGNYIFSGLQTRNYDAVLVGCAAAALLALGLDALLRILARGYSERRPALVLAGGAILLAVGRPECRGARAGSSRASAADRGQDLHRAVRPGRGAGPPDSPEDGRAGGGARLARLDGRLRRPGPRRDRRLRRVHRHDPVHADASGRSRSRPRRGPGRGAPLARRDPRRGRRVLARLREHLRVRAAPRPGR